MSSPQSAAKALSDTLGVDLTCTQGPGGHGAWFDLRPTAMPKFSGFAIRVQRGINRIEATFTPEAYAGPLVRAMGEADAVSREVFTRIAGAAIDDGASVQMVIDGKPADATSDNDWPSEWHSLGIVVKRHGALSPGAASDGPVVQWVGRLMAMVLALAPVEVTDDLAESGAGLPEGALTRVETNRYERNPRHRAACIAVHGTDCSVCGFCFCAAYGGAGQGFIHVHHNTPVSVLSEGMPFDPIDDLTPVCPNCHAMLHTEDPPLTADELRRRIATEGGRAASLTTGTPVTGEAPPAEHG